MTGFLEYVTQFTERCPGQERAMGRNQDNRVVASYIRSASRVIVHDGADNWRVFRLVIECVVSGEVMRMNKSELP